MPLYMFEIQNNSRPGGGSFKTNLTLPEVDSIGLTFESSLLKPRGLAQGCSCDIRGAESRPSAVVLDAGFPGPKTVYRFRLQQHGMCSTKFNAFTLPLSYCRVICNGWEPLATSASHDGEPRQPTGLVGMRGV